MKRFQLSSLMLVVVIVALVLGMIVQEIRYRRREVDFRAETIKHGEGVRVLRTLYEKHLRDLNEGFKERLQKQDDAKGQD